MKNEGGKRIGMSYQKIVATDRKQFGKITRKGKKGISLLKLILIFQSYLCSFSLFDKGEKYGQKSHRTLLFMNKFRIKGSFKQSYHDFCIFQGIYRPFNFITIQQYLLVISTMTMYTHDSSSNQSTYSTRSHECSNPSSKNVLPNLHDALKLEKVKKINPQFMVQLKGIESKKKSEFKAVRMIVAFMLARDFLEDEDIKILHRHFLGVCALKIKAQVKKLEKAKRARRGFHLRNIEILETFAAFIQQMLDASFVSEEFLHRMLSFIFTISEGKGGFDGRSTVQVGKIKTSLEYLQRTFHQEREVRTQQVEIEEIGEEEKGKIEEQKEDQKVEDDFMALLEGDEFVEISILGLENPDYKIIAISLEREQEKEIKYVGRLSKTQSQKL